MSSNKERSTKPPESKRGSQSNTVVVNATNVEAKALAKVIPVNVPHTWDAAIASLKRAIKRTGTTDARNSQMAKYLSVRYEPFKVQEYLSIKEYFPVSEEEVRQAQKQIDRRETGSSGEPSPYASPRNNSPLDLDLIQCSINKIADELKECGILGSRRRLDQIVKRWIRQGSVN